MLTQIFHTACHIITYTEVDTMEKILYGAAYYDEYMPYERLDKDIELMKKAELFIE